MEYNIDEFQAIVNELLESVPKDIKSKIENVEFIVLEKPTQMQMINHKGRILLGLYEGVPLLKRGRSYNAVLPDRIYLFMNPILYVADIEKVNITEKIKTVLLHEIGHYFGLSEEELRNLGMF